MPEYTDIIITVDGIGDQSRNATVRTLAKRLARLPSLACDEVLNRATAIGIFPRGSAEGH